MVVGLCCDCCSGEWVVFGRRLDFGEWAVTCVLVGCEQQT
jgi:hypothetical protein